MEFSPATRPIRSLRLRTP